MASGHGVTKTDTSSHPNRRVHSERFQGPVRPIETEVHARNLQSTNALDYLNDEGKANAAMYNANREEHFRKYGHGI